VQVLEGSRPLKKSRKTKQNQNITQCDMPSQSTSTPVKNKSAPKPRHSPRIKDLARKKKGASTRK